MIADAAHNPAGMAVTVQALTESFNFDRIIGVVAVPEDKDVAGLLEELEPALSDIVVTTNSSPRSMPVDELAELAAEIFGEDRVQVAERLDDAIDLAVSIADVFDAEAVAPGPPRRRGRARDRLGRHRRGRPAAARPGPGGRRRSANPGAPEPGTPARHSFTLGELS